MKTLNRLFIASGLAGAMLLSACGGEEAPSGPKYNFERAESLPDGYLRELGIIKTNIEVTAGLYEDMNANGYSFTESMLLPAGKSFSGSTKQALGIGAVGSDMVYCATFGQTQSAMSRMEGLMKTAGALGVAEAFDQELIEKMAGEDTTINKSVLLTKAYLNAKDQLFSEERAQYATFMVIGGWLEGLHIVSHLAQDKIANDNIRIGIWSVVDSYDNVVRMCEVFTSNAEMQKVAEQLKSIEPQINKIKKNAKKFKEEDVAALAEAADGIRNNMY